MSTPINFNKVRKARARAEKRAKGDANAAKFGRTKAERKTDAERTARAERFLDQRERDKE